MDIRSDGALVEVLVTTEHNPHDDVVWTLAGEEFVCDGYYLAIDPEYERRWLTLSGGQFMRRAVADLLEQWDRHIGALRARDAVYLPFAWWDQGSQFLRCRRDHDRAFLATVVSELEGHQFRPSDISPVVRREHYPPGVHLSEAEIRLDRLLTDIRSARDSLLSG